MNYDNYHCNLTLSAPHNYLILLELAARAGGILTTYSQAIYQQSEAFEFEFNCPGNLATRELTFIGSVMT